ncbi:MAG: RHS repeat-associated core domain-containing protein [Thermodesulfobacteriota bacterium]
MKPHRSVSALLLLLCALLGSPASVFGYDRPWDAGHYTTNLPPPKPPKPPKDPCEESTGSPVYMRVGNLILGFTDMELPGGPLPMEVHRNYNNQEKYNGPFGHGWVSTFTFQLVPVVRNNTIHQVIIRRDLGQRLTFNRNPDGTFTPENKNSYDVLVDNGDGTFTLNPICSACGGGSNQQLLFNSSGYLASISDANGNSIAFTYDTGNRLVRAEDNLGRFFTYTYSGDKVAQVSDSAGRSSTYRYDLNDNLVAATNPAGNTVSYSYDADHNLISMVDPKGNTALTVTYDSLDRVATYTQYGDSVTYTYDTANNKTTKTDSLGNAATFTYDPLHGVITLIRYNNGTPADATDDFEEKMEYDAKLNLVRFTDGRGFITSYTYNAQGRKTSENDALGNVRSFTYDTDGRLLTETSARGAVTKYEYDTRGNLLNKYQAFGTADQIVESFTYDNLGRKQTATDAAGNTMTFGYDAGGRLVTITDPYNQVITRNTYSDLGMVTTSQDVFNFPTSFEYDALGRVTAVTDPLGNRATKSYDANGNLQSETDVNGAVTSYEYNFFNQQVKITDPKGNITEKGYTVKGDLRWVKDALGHYTWFQYNGRGQLWKKIVKIGDSAETPDGDDLVTVYTYDNSGNRISTTFPGGGVQTESYDGLGRITTRTLPTGEQIVFTYDADGNLLSQQNGNGLTLSYEYDSLNRPVRMYDSLGTIRTYTYDGLGHPLSITDAAGNTTTFAYDKRGKQVRRTYADGNSDTIAYDPAGRIQSVTDRGGRSISFTRDKVGRVLFSTDALGQKTTAVYSGDRLQSLSDPKGSTTRYQYDVNGNKIREIYADGTSVSYAYDALNRMVSRTGADGATISFTYDERGQLTKRDYPGTDNDDVFTYGPDGELLTAANSDFNIARTYDTANRLLSETVSGQTVSYAYDTANLLRTITYPGGRVVKEVFDSRERLASLTDGNDVSLADLQYNGNNKRASLSYANGITAQYTYDSINLLAGIAFSAGTTPVLDHAYGRTGLGRLRSVEDKVEPARSNVFQYDAIDRITGFKAGTLANEEITAPDRQIAYAYDPASNMVTRSENGASETRTVNAVNGYLSAAGVAFVHDGNGNLTDDGSQTYAYDSQNRLVRVTRKADGQVLAAIAYDPLGRMGSLTSAGGTVHFCYDQRDRIIEEQQGGVTVATYLYGPGMDELLAMERGGQTYSFHRDAQGNPLVATDDTGAVVERYSYDPYGRATIRDSGGTTLAASTIGNDFLFQDKLFVPEAGLYYFRARFYSPVLGRFISRDPSGYNDGMNLYEYAHSNPVNFTDPLGLAAQPSESCKVSGQIGFDIGKLAKVTKVIKAFGADFQVGGGVQVTASACDAKCCKKQISYTKWQIEADFSMTYSGVVPNLGIAVPGVGQFGVIGTVQFGIKGSGTFAQSFDANCNIVCNSEVCVGVYGSVSLMAGAKLAEAGDDPQVSDPFGGEVGIKGSAGASGMVCYGCQGWKFKACINGKIELVASVKVFWVSFGGSVEIIGGETCTENLQAT